MSTNGNASMRRIVMGAVTTIWALSFIADIIIADYSPSPYIHMAMMAVLGALFGREVLGKDGD